MYNQAHELLVPKEFDEWRTADDELRTKTNDANLLQAFEQAITEGQYEFPTGLFFGGHQPSDSRNFIENLFDEIDEFPRNNISVIDIHSGLGPYGHGEIICEHSDNTAALARALRWYGESVTEPAKGTSFSPPKVGLMDFAWEHRFPNEICFITLEFGTFPKEVALHWVRQDHCLHQYGQVELSSPRARRIKRQLVRSFYPNTQTWNELVLYRGQQVIAQAINGMCNK